MRRIDVRTALRAGGRRGGVTANALLVAGAVLVAGSAVIHLHLWSMGYRQIPTIGPLFLFQGVLGLALALVVALARQVWAALGGAVFMASTIGGFLISVYMGIFGFQDTWSAPYATTAVGVETGAVVLLVSGSLACLVRGSTGATRLVSEPFP